MVLTPATQKPGSRAKPSLQERKRRATRDALLDALGEVVREQGINAFSVQDVANRAGLSHRTVYRVFESREALLEGARAWVAELVAEQGIPEGTNLDDLAPHIESLFRVLDRQPDLVSAAVQLDIGKAVRPEGSRRRDDLLRGLIEAEFPSITQQERDAGYAALRLLYSAQTWFLLRSQQGLSGAQSGSVVASAIRVLIEDLRNRESQVKSGKAATSQRAS